MNKEIKNVNLAFSCPFSWNEFSECRSEKFCDSCKNTVYDFTDKDQSDLQNLLKSNHGVCGRFSKKQLSAGFLRYALTTLIVTTLGVNASCQEVEKKEAIKEIDQPVPAETTFFGLVVERMPIPKFDPEELKRLLAQKINLPPNSPEGKIIIRYIVDSTGKVVNPEIVRGINSEIDQKVLETFKELNLEYVPAQQSGKTINVNYMLPIILKSQTLKH